LRFKTTNIYCSCFKSFCTQPTITTLLWCFTSSIWNFMLSYSEMERLVCASL